MAPDSLRPPSARQPAAIIVNPLRVRNPERLRADADAIAQRHGLPSPELLFTTPDDVGRGLAEAAVRRGASSVIALGGDGTTRSVASGVAGSGVPLGLVPRGTGNLFARNLGLPIRNRMACLEIAMTGSLRSADVGWLSIPELGVEEHLFLVVGGIGLDADMVAGADEELKRRIGWLAYFFAALPRLPRFMDVTAQVDGRIRAEPFRSRTVMVANAARLPLGLALSPAARFDDGLLDILTLDTRAGLVGWISLGTKVALQGFGLTAPKSLASTISSRTGKNFRITASESRQVQVDGELVGKAREIVVRVDEGALLVRTV